jgi:hypothetical protein
MLDEGCKLYNYICGQSKARNMLLYIRWDEDDEEYVLSILPDGNPILVYGNMIEQFTLEHPVNTTIYNHIPYAFNDCIILC